MLAGLKGVSAATKLGIGHVHMESDSTRQYNLSALGGLLYEIKSIVAASFISFRISFCPRACNEAAHVVVAIGNRCNLNASLSWDDVPPGVEDAIAGDFATSLV
uniref:RNase H type-1 domain-containing protein n=1 Tax=Leersia perrieri TaxID=77586 RepID=A0A0D9VWR9_9ORYZ